MEVFGTTDTVKTTITFNPTLEKEAKVLGALYEKGKFSTNIKQKLIEVFEGQERIISYKPMSNEQLISNLATLLFEIDNRGIDISKMIAGYCNATVQVHNKDYDVDKLLFRADYIPQEKRYIYSDVKEVGEKNNNIEMENKIEKEVIDEEQLEQDILDSENCGIDLC